MNANNGFIFTGTKWIQKLGKLLYHRSSPEMKTTLKMWGNFLFVGNKLKKTKLPNNSIGEFCFIFSKQSG